MKIPKFIMVKTAVILILSALILSCGTDVSENLNAGTNASNNANTSAQNNANGNTEVAGENLTLFGTGETSKIPCNGKEVEVDPETTASRYTLTGECKKITVDGVSNEIFVDKVGEIVVKGTSNKVIYGEGLNGKPPKISKSGVSTIVESKKAADEKKAAKEKKEVEETKSAEADKPR